MQLRNRNPGIGPGLIVQYEPGQNRSVSGQKYCQAVAGFVQLLSSAVLTDKTGMTNYNGCVVVVPGQAAGKVIVHIAYRGVRAGEAPEHPADGVLRVLLKTACQRQTVCLGHLRIGPGLLESQRTFCDRTRFVENHRINLVKGFQRMAASGQEPHIAELHGGTGNRGRRCQR